MISKLRLKRNPMRLMTSFTGPSEIVTRQTIVELTLVNSEIDDIGVADEALQNLEVLYGELPDTVVSADQNSDILFFRAEELKGFPPNSTNFLFEFELGKGVAVAVYSATWNRFVVKDSDSSVVQLYELPVLPEEWCGFIAASWHKLAEA